MSTPHIYADRQLAFLTQHGKERVVAPILEPGLGCVIAHVQGFDTDSLGTFTGETPRPGTQLAAARLKARKGMELSGLPLGLASEGSFGPDPFTGMFPWNIELLVWIDDVLGLEVVGMAQGPAHNEHLLSGQWEEVQAFAARHGFPAHQLVLRPNGPSHPHIHKGIADWDRLKTCFEDCLRRSERRLVSVEMDLRAFANPSRMQLIEQAAYDLLQRLRSPCPSCESPGFWISERKPGLPCAACGQPTSVYVSELWACPRCKAQSLRVRTDLLQAEPRHCGRCNP